jgi:multiple sugar transport system permease protein
MSIISPTSPTTSTSRHGRLDLVLGRDWRLGYLLVLPVVLVVIGLIAYPFGYSIWLSLNDIKVGGAGRFIGLENYTNLLSGQEQRDFLNSAQVSFMYTIVALLGKFTIGMITALILSSAIRAKNIFRAILFLPWTIPAVVSAFTWKWLYDDRLGMFNFVLTQTGVIHERIGFLVDTNLALWSLTAAAIWQGTPFWTMCFVAAMQSIPQELYEAAEIDGCGALQSFWNITLPSLVPVILVTTMLSTIWTANSLEYVYNLTLGGPAHLTETFPMLAILRGIRSFNLGVGATIPLMFMPFFAILIIFLTRRMLSEE